MDINNVISGRCLLLVCAALVAVTLFQPVNAQPLARFHFATDAQVLVAEPNLFTWPPQEEEPDRYFSTGYAFKATASLVIKEFPWNDVGLSVIYARTPSDNSAILDALVTCQNCEPTGELSFSDYRQFGVFIEWGMSPGEQRTFEPYGVLRAGVLSQKISATERGPLRFTEDFGAPREYIATDLVNENLFDITRIGVAGGAEAGVQYRLANVWNVRLGANYRFASLYDSSEQTVSARLSLVYELY